MSSQTPYARLVGTWLFWLAPAGEAIPDLDASVAGNWVALGKTDGNQELKLTGSLDSFSDNSHTGKVKHIRPEEGAEVSFSLAEITLEDLAQISSMATSDVTTSTSGLLNVKELPLKRGYIPTRYALLARGGAVEASNLMSAYGAWPAQLWIPQGVFDTEPALTFGKGESPAPDALFVAEQDDTNGFGKLQMQSS